MDINSLSTPPTEEELEKFTPVDPDTLPRKYTRDINSRIFVNRSVNLDNIEYFGFDMDYTLAVYNSPAFEDLQIKLTVERLIKRGYPKEIENIRFDPGFAVRGLFLDKKNGNLVHLDNFGFLLACVHGFKVIPLNDSQLLEWYPDKIVHPSEIGKRYYCFDTLFGLPEAYLYASLVDFFEKTHQESHIQEKGPVEISYWSLFDDVRECTHEIHVDGSIKQNILGDLPSYIRKDDRLITMLRLARQNNKKTFLLTNSEFYYTTSVMEYMLSSEIAEEGYDSWRDYFDIIITNACKPRFFMEGSTLREINLETGAPKFTSVSKQFEKGKIYAGGNFAMFKKLTGTKGGEVLYVGDNIMHDIVQTKKSRCLWRTLLIVRELEQETGVWANSLHHWNHIQNLEYLRAKTYRNMNSADGKAPNDTPIKKHIAMQSEKMDAQFNPWFGSSFRKGTSESFFSSQVKRFADLYASDCLNLLSYPHYYYFSSLPQLLPHELEALHNAKNN